MILKNYWNPWKHTRMAYLFHTLFTSPHLPLRDWPPGLEPAGKDTWHTHPGSTAASIPCSGRFHLQDKRDSASRLSRQPGCFFPFVLAQVIWQVQTNKTNTWQRDILIPIFNLAEDQENHEFWRTVKLKNGNEITIQMRAMDFNVNGSSFKFL